ncbi:MAG: class I SAM-dependent methyltransferase [Pseudomonadota bacterium]
MLKLFSSRPRQKAIEQPKKTAADELAEFVHVVPDPQNAFDVFPNAWSTAFDDVKTGGSFGGTKDSRITWLCEQLDLSGKTVLELGPLEAGHTYMLERAGADVLAIEANKGSFLRCLIAKNHLDLKSRFMLGNFETMDIPAQTYDLIVASGVLYHMTDPVALLTKLSKASDSLFIWTHYFDPDFSIWNPGLKPDIDAGKWHYKNPETVETNEMTVRMVRQDYKQALEWSGFCGGTEDYSKWIYKEDLLNLLTALGYTSVDVSFDDPAHLHGPSFCVLATK